MTPLYASIVITPTIARCLFDKAMATSEHIYFTTAEEAFRQLAIEAVLLVSREPIEGLFMRAAALPGMSYIIENRKHSGYYHNDTEKTIYLSRMLAKEKKEFLNNFVATLPLKANL